MENAKESLLRVQCANDDDEKAVVVVVVAGVVAVVDL
jgi:hypothetical protein